MSFEIIESKCFKPGTLFHIPETNSKDILCGCDLYTTTIFLGNGYGWKCQRKTNDDKCTKGELTKFQPSIFNNKTIPSLIPENLKEPQPVKEGDVPKVGETYLYQPKETDLSILHQRGSLEPFEVMVLDVIGCSLQNGECKKDVYGAVVCDVDGVDAVVDSLGSSNFKNFQPYGVPYDGLKFKLSEMKPNKLSKFKPGTKVLVESKTEGVDYCQILGVDYSNSANSNNGLTYLVDYKGCHMWVAQSKEVAEAVGGCLWLVDGSVDDENGTTVAEEQWEGC